MTKVLLINRDKIPHYRVAVYNHLSGYLKQREFALTVASNGIEEGNPHPVEFDCRKLRLSFFSLAKLILELHADVVILWLSLRYLYLFPIIIFTKIVGKRVVCWGHGRDLLDVRNILKNMAYAVQHWLSDAIILYSKREMKYVSRSIRRKVFVANNTLNMTIYDANFASRDRILAKYNIKTRKNIICMGRLQKRKRLEDLYRAFKRLDNGQYGLILVGPDTEGVTKDFTGENIYRLGPVYGDEALALLSAADVYCLPGHVGLSIVDAFYCGLPLVTEVGDHAPEIVYLQDGINGFAVPKGDVTQLAARLKELLENDSLREEFSRAARREIALNGHIDVMCRGFEEALRFVSPRFTKVMLINQDKIPHYRVPIYNYLGAYLKRRGYLLTVLSSGVQDGNPHQLAFDYREIPLSFNGIAKLFRELRPHVVIFWVNLRYLYLFPTLLVAKLMGMKTIYWGHGRDLFAEHAKVKNAGYALEHYLCDAIILYADHLRKYVWRGFDRKVFVANNTLNMTIYDANFASRDRILAKYNIKTRKNIICMGRLQKRKRLEDLYRAFKRLDNGQYGLILVGPDTEGVTKDFTGENIYRLGPVYGDEAVALLSAADICCIPGAVGLSIVDAFHSGLPLVTEEGEISPEIMYLKESINGFAVPKGDVTSLASALKTLLENDELRAEFSRAAKNEIMSHGHIDNMCDGFYKALEYVDIRRSRESAEEHVRL